MLDAEFRRVVDGATIAHLATVLPDGAPHSPPAYVGTYDDQIVLFTGSSTPKGRNLRRDPRLALSIAPGDNPFAPVVVRGRVVDGSLATRHGRSSTTWSRSTPTSLMRATASDGSPSSRRRRVQRRPQARCGETLL